MSSYRAPSYRLGFSNYLHPLWVSRLGNRRVRSVVSADASVAVEGKILSLRPEDAHTLPPGTEVEVWLDKHFFCSRLMDLAQEESVRAEEARRRERERIQWQAQDDERRNLQRDAALQQASFLRLPIKWMPGVKVANSNPSGRLVKGSRARMITHIMLLENLHGERFKRSAGAFLCAPPPAISDSRDQQCVAAPHSTDGHGQAYAPAITCKQCLKIAKRWVNTSDPVQMDLLAEDG